MKRSTKIALALAAAGGLIAWPAFAMTGGQPQVVAPKWMVAIEAYVGAQQQLDCTGALVGNGWVITAGHCTFYDGKELPLNSYTAVLGSTDIFLRPGENVSYSVDAVRVAPGFSGADEAAPGDVALFHLHDFDESRWDALPLAFEPSVVHTGGGVTLYGYGNAIWSGGQQARAGGLLKSPDGAFHGTSCTPSTYLCFNHANRVMAMNGDSGGPWLDWVSGGWQLIGVHKAVYLQGPTAPTNPKSLAVATATLYTMSAGQTILQWVRQTAQLPTASPGAIVRNSTTGAAWLIDSSGYRESIPTGSIYECLLGNGSYPAQFQYQLDIDTIPERVGTQAACTPKPPSPAPRSPSAQPQPSHQPSATPAPSTPGSQPSPTSGPVVGNPSVALAQGPTAPKGYRYAVSLSGFIPNGVVSVTCFDSVSGHGFFTFTLHTDSSGTASTASECYSGDGPDHWVTAHGIQSNHVTWNAPAPPPPPQTSAAPPPPPAPTTYSEQEGHHGVNTFTNYHNASGMGPFINPASWVQVSCKVYDSTIPSANPDGYWYRIASSPWNNQYYSPANTFMNGDPWGGPYTHNTDFNVPNC